MAAADAWLSRLIERPHIHTKGPWFIPYAGHVTSRDAIFYRYGENNWSEKATDVQKKRSAAKLYS